ncbi:TlpA family protein disulfide reductase [Kaarinaea lacus]
MLADANSFLITKMRDVAAIVSLVVILVFISGCQQSLPPLKVQPGQVIESLSVKDLKGKDSTLSIATGKVLVLNVWATWCGPCRHEMPSLDRLSQKLDNDNFLVVGLSVDTDDHVVREFLIERKVSFANYMDPTMAVANEVFGIRAFPSTFVFAPDGRLLEVIEGWRTWDAPEMFKKINSYFGSS